MNIVSFYLLIFFGSAIDSGFTRRSRRRRFAVADSRRWRDLQIIEFDSAIN